MTRIAGVDIPESKPVGIALTKIYGIGRQSAVVVLDQAKVNQQKRVSQLTNQEIAAITGALAKYKIEGDLRKEVSENIKRLKEIGSYRGLRHSRNLPVRGQRTRSNARTKRGKRVTIGALKKEVIAKTEKNREEKPTKTGVTP
jgi:small subunit ribosomal protein S13